MVQPLWKTVWQFLKRLNRGSLYDSIVLLWHCLKTAQAAITRHYRVDNLNNRHLFFSVIEAEMFNIKVLVASFPGGDLPGLQTGTFLLCAHMEEREKALVSLPLPIRTLTPWGWVSHPHGLIEI